MSASAMQGGHNEFLIEFFFSEFYLQRFDDVCLTSGRASGL